MAERNIQTKIHPKINAVELRYPTYEKKFAFFCAVFFDLTTKQVSTIERYVSIIMIPERVIFT